MLQITRTRTRVLALNVVAVSCLAAATLTATATAQAQVRAERLGLATQQAGNPLLVREADRGVINNKDLFTRATIFLKNGEDPRKPFPRTGKWAFLNAIGVTKTDGPTKHIWQRIADPDGIKPTTTTYKTDVFEATGFMVSPCHMLTNFHTVFGEVDVKPDYKQDHFVYFSVGQQPGGGFKYKDLKGQVVLWGNELENFVADWALVVLPTCPGSDPEIGWLDIFGPGKLLSEGQEIAMFGFPMDRPNSSLTGETGCHVLQYQKAKIGVDGFLFDCSAVGGHSGSPLIAFYNGRPFVMGIVFGVRNGGHVPMEGVDERYLSIGMGIYQVLYSGGAWTAYIKPMIEKYKSLSGTSESPTYLNFPSRNEANRVQSAENQPLRN